MIFPNLYRMLEDEYKMPFLWGLYISILFSKYINIRERPWTVNRQIEARNER
jgi:hypothetical protein